MTAVLLLHPILLFPQVCRTGSQQQAVQQQQSAESARGECLPALCSTFYRDQFAAQYTGINVGCSQVPPTTSHCISHQQQTKSQSKGCKVSTKALLPRHYPYVLIIILSVLSQSSAACSVHCRRGLLWKIPVVLLSLGLAAAGGYYGFKQYEEHRDKKDSKNSSKPATAKK